MSTLTLRSAKGAPLTNTEVDTNFSNLNSDKYEQGDSPSFANLTLSGNFNPSLAATVSAAGTTQGAGTALTKTINMITSATASSAEAVVLPTAAAGVNITIINTTAVTIKVFPATSDAIDGGTANANVNLAPNSSVTLIAADATNWYRVTNLIVYDASGNRLN